MIYNMVSLRDQGVIYLCVVMRTPTECVAEISESLPEFFFPLRLSASTLPDLTLQPS